MNFANFVFHRRAKSKIECEDSHTIEFINDLPSIGSIIYHTVVAHCDSGTAVQSYSYRVCDTDTPIGGHLRLNFFGSSIKL